MMVTAHLTLDKNGPDMKHTSIGFLLVWQLLTSSCNVCAFQRDFQSSKGVSRVALMARRRRRNNSDGPRRFQEKNQTTNTMSLSYKQPRTKKIHVAIGNDGDSVVLVQVHDDEYWTNANANDNPYGAKLWPAALATANLLCAHEYDICNRSLIELGCGTGLVSIVAARTGAKVIATDVSTMALSLVRDGWKETQSPTDHSCQMGTLEVREFDITSSKPLSSLLQETKEPPIVVATTMMYQPQLAKALTRRVAEAHEKLGAWVIIGDDDTGRIARLEFEAELERLLGDSSGAVEWREATVASSVFGWKQKNTRIMQLNSPIR